MTQETITASFDKAARVYDDEFERLPATRRLRNIIWKTYYQYFRSGASLLELNCGTGTDAIELASNGIYVLATDASEEMIRESERKLAATALKPFVQTQVLSFHRLNQLYGTQFDGAYSNFGGLNCTRRLDDIASTLGALVKPGGHLVLCLMSRFSLWETMSFLARIKPRTAFRRLNKNGCLVNVNGEKVWVHYYSPNQVVSLFSRYFIPVDAYGLNIFSPPPSSVTAYKLLGPVVRALDRLDELVARAKPFYAIGDHYVIVLQRKG